MPSAETPRNDPLSGVAELWADAFRRADAQWRAGLEAWAALGDPKAAQARWAEAATRSADEYVRSPPFLEMMRLTARAVTDWKAHQDRLAREALRAFGLPHADDVSEVATRARRAELALADRLDGLEELLREVARRLDHAPRNGEPQP